MRKFLVVVCTVSVTIAVIKPASGQVTAPAASRQSTVQTLSESDPVSWVRPKVVVPPEYPAAALEKKVTGYVDVDILVSEEGLAGEIRSVASTPTNMEFEDAVRQVIKLWSFHAPMSNCRPFETVGNVRVWFDIKGEGGVVSVSNRAPNPVVAASAPKSKIVSLNSAAVRAAVRYPTRARRAGASGNVYIKFMVEPRTGSIAKIDVMYAKSKPGGFEDDFAEVSKAAVAQFKMEPMPDRDKPVAGCVPFVFRLT